jgi:hypothetical protein
MFSEVEHLNDAAEEVKDKDDFQGFIFVQPKRNKLHGYVAHVMQEIETSYFSVLNNLAFCKYRADNTQEKK